MVAAIRRMAGKIQEVSFEGPTERRAAVDRRWHLLYNMVPDNTWELYDLAHDPLEQSPTMRGAGRKLS